MREAEREAREDARRERAQQLEMICSMMHSQTALLQNLIAWIPALQNPGPQTVAQHYPAPAHQRQFSSPTPLYYNQTTEEFDSFHPAASSSFQQLD